MPFPSNFVWGAASSSYQIEGAWNAEGKVASNWDAFSHAPGNVFMGHTGDVACDHYHRYVEDVALMKSIGLKAYRFSISWPRVIPEPPCFDLPSTVNHAGLDFYDRLVDELLRANIAPWATLFHWDLPLWVYERGGWLNRDIVAWFADYADIVVSRLSDRVTNWMTINEPQIFLGPSENEGLQTSNARKGNAERLLTAHHALLCHGGAVDVIRDRAKKPPSIGWAPIGRVRVPAHPDGHSTPRPEDIAAARLATNSVLHRDFWNNTWFADPVVFGRYPEDGLRLYLDEVTRSDDGRTWRTLTNPKDLEAINRPIDFYGINVYDAERYCAAPDGAPKKIDYPPGHPQTAIRWFIDSSALYWGPKFLYERYKIPLVVTENGMSSHDWVDLDGKVRDTQRIDYTRRYLQAIERAITEGADIRGYFHWSILDNFEWQQGYKERFGLIHVDFTTLKRTVKESAHWYRRIIETNGAALRESIKIA